MTRTICVFLFALMPVIAVADLEIFACEPEWAALAKEIGGSHVNTFSATTALQDPHYIQARPSLIAKVRRANLLICSGAQLEIGWLPALLQKANNRKVLPGSNGYMEASAYVVRVDATGNVDRAQGDIHPEGNPHIQTDPHNIAAVAKPLAERLMSLDPENAAAYAAGLEDFLGRWHDAIETWEAQARILRGARGITHHKSWVYLERWLGIEEAANLEAIPGLPPTATHLSRLTKQFEQGGADFIIRSPYQDARPSEWLSERTGIPAIVLPLTVGGTERAQDLFSLYDDIVDRLLTASKHE
ncbi:MAG: zinc ABC transporter substrate-binding protein [Gammaproteobacteria bacterium]|nr:zinc ABC transporter substrate-binding protein [Gammaproteobacteria bacterium]MBT8111111.1 zinc ABC transporter substrate-binding protein [Gammaproteobacteria bacterium]NND48028.1 zinc ABC transporter solute-binding protein [Woeseiaceae bacterium]NNL45809.1 zinc ABC transporter solute-binding protein [Woeseiaceae bacterium]